MRTWWSAFCSAKWKLPATLLTCMKPSRWQPSPTCLRSSAMASLSSKTPGSSSARSLLSSVSPPPKAEPPSVPPCSSSCSRPRWELGEDEAGGEGRGGEGRVGRG